ncbi:MAG: hypothetical protein AAGC55_26480, partial [Myxococcota bacterium]
LRADGERATIEIIGDSSLLVEQHGSVDRRDFDDERAVGEFVAAFLIDSLNRGLQLVFGPARMRKLVLGRQRAAAEVPPEQRADAAIRYLLAEDSLELAECDDEDEREEQFEDLVDAAGRYLEKHRAVPNLAVKFADWLTQHQLVVDVYADDDAVRAALAAVDSERDPGVS